MERKPLPDWLVTTLALAFVATSVVGGAIFLALRWLVRRWMP